MKKETLNKLFIKSLNLDPNDELDYSNFPLKFCFNELRPNKCISYLWEITDPPGGRSVDENKIQVILPGHKRGQRANFSHESDYFTLLVGYRKDIRIFTLWDAYMYENIPFSRNVQVKEKTLFNAISDGIQIQERRLWVGPENVITSNAFQLKDAISLRYDMYLGIYE